ncbi:MAG: cob(I)yrinic acid a,c-diamide adenosyltransferase [Anaerolineales bacterium]
MPPFYTRDGDDGTTRLLGPERVPKDDPRPEAYGSVDEASAALGVARAQAQSAETRSALLVAQRDLYHVMAELAASADLAERFRRIDAARVAWLEAETDRFASQVQIPKDFVVFGDTSSGAALDHARTTVRRAERRLAGLLRTGSLPNADLLRYLNRLSSLCFVLALWENERGGVATPPLAKASS